MRVLVTGPTNPAGRAVVEALAAAGHSVRAFGIPAGENPFAGLPGVECFPGHVEIGGSVEPAACECQAIVHCAALDAPGDDKRAHALHIERGTLYTRFAAERELVGRFVAVFLASPERAWGAVLRKAEVHARGTHAGVPTIIFHVSSAEEAAQKVVATLSQLVPA